MANDQDRNATRRADPENAAKDPGNAEAQERLQRDHEALQRSAGRVESSVPPEIRNRTVGEIVEAAERRADQQGRGTGNS